MRNYHYARVSDHANSKKDAPLLNSMFSLGTFLATTGAPAESDASASASESGSEATPVPVLNLSKRNLPPPQAGGECCNTGAGCGTRCVNRFCLTTTCISITNWIAVGVHLLMFIVSLSSLSRGQKIYELKYDRIHSVPRSKDSSLNFSIPVDGVQRQVPVDFLQLRSPWTGSSLADATSAGHTIGDTCGAARPNQLGFGGTQNFTIDMWTYPHRSGM